MFVYLLGSLLVVLGVEDHGYDIRGEDVGRRDKGPRQFGLV